MVDMSGKRCGLVKGLLAVLLAVLLPLIWCGPTQALTINSGAAYVASPDVVLGLTPPAACYQMNIANETGATSAFSPASTLNWSLSAGEGSKNVSVTYLYTYTSSYSCNPYSCNPYSCYCGLFGCSTCWNTCWQTCTQVNQAVSSESASTILDQTPPSLNVPSVVDGSYTNATPMLVTGTASDANGIASLTVNGTSLTPGALDMFGISIDLTPGSNPISVVATDPAGNTSSVTPSIFLDQTPPQLTVDTPADNSYTNGVTVTVSGSASDNGLLQGLTLNGNAVTVNPDGTFSQSVTLAEGANAIDLVATDAASNQTPATRNVTLDTVPPALTFTAPADGAMTNQATLTVSGTATDAVALAGVTLNGVSVALDASGQFSTNLTLASGSNPLTLVATDLAGNSTTLVRSVTYDAQAPSLAVTAPAQDQTVFLNTLLLTGTASDLQTGVGVSIDFDGQTLTPTLTAGGFEQLLTFTTEKVYSVTVTATDGAGNSSSVVRQINYAHSLWGDVNRDGFVDVADAQAALQSAVGSWTPTSEGLLYGDVAPQVGGVPQPDGQIDTGDALMILKKVVGLVSY